MLLELSLQLDLGLRCECWMAQGLSAQGLSSGGEVALPGHRETVVERRDGSM
jgi:hypothetical protein